MRSIKYEIDHHVLWRLGCQEDNLHSKKLYRNLDLSVYHNIQTFQVRRFYIQKGDDNEPTS
jgi:hypothetical protein